jgi:hypothetical protein
LSEIRANTVSDAAGTGPATLTGQYAAKAWVNFNGTGTVAIRESGNVSSLTDYASGQYGVNFSNSFSSINYSVCGSCSTEVGVNTGAFAMPFVSHTGADPQTPTVSAFRIASVRSNGQDATEVDNPYVLASVFGDLA